MAGFARHRETRLRVVRIGGLGELRLVTVHARGGQTLELSGNVASRAGDVGVFAR